MHIFQELKSKYGASLNTRIFNNLIRLAKHSKSEAEAALNDFLEILSDERFVSFFIAYYLRKFSYYWFSFEVGGNIQSVLRNYSIENNEMLIIIKYCSKLYP